MLFATNGHCTRMAHDLQEAVPSLQSVNQAVQPNVCLRKSCSLLCWRLLPMAKLLLESNNGWHFMAFKKVRVQTWTNGGKIAKARLADWLKLQTKCREEMLKALALRCQLLCHSQELPAPLVKTSLMTSVLVRGHPRLELHLVV